MAVDVKLCAMCTINHDDVVLGLPDHMGATLAQHNQAVTMTEEPTRKLYLPTE